MKSEYLRSLMDELDEEQRLLFRTYRPTWAETEEELLEEEIELAELILGK